MKKHMRFMKSILFICLGCIILCAVVRVLQTPLATDSANGIGQREIYRYRNQYDVLVLGASTAIYNINNQELYEKYGIASISLGEPQQPAYMSYYTLLDALTVQTPKVVIYDTRNLFYDDTRVKTILSNDAYIHFSVDGMRSKAKQLALQDTLKYVEELDMWDYYSKWYYSHENWKDLTRHNFCGYDKRDSMNGNAVLFNILDGEEDIYYGSKSQVTIPRNSIIALENIASLCEQKNIKLIVSSNYAQITWHEEKSISSLCKEMGIPYLSMHNCLNEIGFDFRTDCSDNIHLNLSGANKWTDYIGEYIVEQYSLADHRGEQAYFRYEEQRSDFQKLKDVMDVKLALLTAHSFDDYLYELKKMDYTNNIVFLAVNGDAAGCLSKEESNILNEIGLQTDLQKLDNSSYAAVISCLGIEEDSAENKEVTLKSNEESDIDYSVTSAGYNSKGVSSIKIEKTDYLQGGRGINIVVYNTEIRSVISAISFDTSCFENPYAQRKHTETITYQQVEVGPNVWSK